MVVQRMTGLATSWERSLRARNRSQNTIDSYLLCVRLLDEFLGLEANAIRREHVESFIADQLATRSVNTAGIRYRSLFQFFNWLVSEDEIESHPMSAMSAPLAADVPIPVVSDDALKRLLRASDGKSFEDRRDSAILRLFVDTPCRISEVTNLLVSGVDFERYEIAVTVKGGERATNVFGPKSALALDRYLRARAAHKHASSERLWLGPRGPMTRSGVAQMLERRCTQAGIPRIHAHQFRHTFAHNWKLKGGSDSDLEQHAHWTSPAMARRYGKALAQERAREAYRKMNPGERI